MALSHNAARLVLIGGLLAGAVGHADGASPTAEIKTIKYPALGETVRQFRGKVVVVDFWSEY